MDRAARKSTMRSSHGLRAVPPPYGFFTVPKCVRVQGAMQRQRRRSAGSLRSGRGSKPPCAGAWAPSGQPRDPLWSLRRQIGSRWARPSLRRGPVTSRASLRRFRLVPAAEALMGLLFANLFWVGLWDLLDTTIFPFDSSYAMLLLVRPLAPGTRRFRLEQSRLCCLPRVSASA